MNYLRKWGYEVNKTLIVESKNDESFLRALVNHLNLRNTNIGKSICSVEDYHCLDGLNLKKLINALKAFKNKLPKNENSIESLGIILDNDGKKEERITLINNAINEVFDSDQTITEFGQFIDVSVDVGGDNYKFRVSCFLIGVNNKGELETLIKAIKTKSSPYADCLSAWRKCVESNSDAELSDKEFDKMWVNNYIRFDTCSKSERRQAHRKCSMYNLNYVLENKKEILDFDHSELGLLKEYLNSFY
jgi:hypothetical protein